MPSRIPVPNGKVEDNSYISRPGHRDEPIPVLSDSEAHNAVDADSNKKRTTSAAGTDQLEQDDKEAINKSNIIDYGAAGKNGDGSNKPVTRGAKPKNGTYKEPGDEEDLPTEDGTSAGAST